MTATASVGRAVWLVAIAICSTMPGAGHAEQSATPTSTLTSADYARAEHFLPWRLQKSLHNLSVTPYWFSDHEFWYRRDAIVGTEFVVVDAATGVRRPAFDHARLAAALSKSIGKPIETGKLPFESFAYTPGGAGLRFQIDDDAYLCTFSDNQCVKDAHGPRLGELLSPDGQWVVFVRECNLWVRSLASSEERALTHDGEAHYAYAVSPESLAGAAHASHHPPAVAVWSPDSTRIFTVQVDERQVRTLSLLQSAAPDGGPVAVLHQYRAALAGDTHVPMSVPVVIDRVSGAMTRAIMPPAYASDVSSLVDTAKWTSDSKTVFFVEPTRGFKVYRLRAMDALTGAVRTVIEEEGQSFLDWPIVQVLGDGAEVIWSSEREGWMQLYLYDGRTGQMRRRLTSGHFVLNSIVAVDERRRVVYFSAQGRDAVRDPYLPQLYRVGLDGKRMTSLTPEDVHHLLIDRPGVPARQRAGGVPPPSSFSPGNDYFVETASTISTAPVTRLHRSDGQVITTLETADIGALSQFGWRAPQSFTAKAVDGKTDLYGAMFFPSNFDATHHYPILDATYPGPQEYRTPHSFPGILDFALTYAELGFIVVTIDGRGTPGRSKAFHDFAFQNMQSAGALEDHIAALRELAARMPYLDLDRVGIYGHSGGGYAAARAILQYPDFYKAAVAASGNHDQRGYLAEWSEKYQGLVSGDNFLAQANPPLAKNLKGRLMLIHGDMDDNVPAALTMQLADALIAANKDFDLVILPNRDHGGAAEDSYAIRRTMDFFVRALLKATPPENYAIQGPEQK